MSRLTFPLILLSALMIGCSDEKPSTSWKRFDEIPFSASGVSFENTVVQDQENHVLNYPYYFNGGGVATGDINNDGLIDIYFTGNMVPNKLYLNKGNFQFEDITDKAGVAAPEGWKTGVTFVDLNQDGWLDIYVSRSAMSDSVLRKNLLFMNNGDLTFSEKSDEYGVGDAAYSTHAAFLDYDKDGDLDMFVLNHSLPQYAGFSNMLINFKKQKSTLFQSRLYRNDGGHFHDVSEEAGIISNVLSFGLGLAVADINLDGYPDLYISNDFNEEDYLFLNNQDGTFRNAIRDATGHVSLFSMGSDIADINNDESPDIFTLDMLPSTNDRIKLSSGDDNYDKYNILINSGFHAQSMRNMLQLNNGDGTFSEIGQLMGISNTDWSWSALFADFNGDGWKDLYVSNGYEKDYTNMQFLKYTVDERLKARQTGAPPDIKEIIGQMPAIDVKNCMFMNNGDLSFTNITDEWGLSRSFKSNGAAYADLDNDGDPDLVVNAMNEKAVIYRNNSETDSAAGFLTIDLRAKNPGRVIVGTKVYVYRNGQSQYQEFSPVRGFQSAMYVPLTFGVTAYGAVDSVRIIWPDDRSQLILKPAGQRFSPAYEDATATHHYKQQPKPLFRPSAILNWTHHPVDTNDFKRQLLLPRMFSYSGPKFAKGDVDGDGREDLYLCGAGHQPGALFLQQKGGTFREKPSAALQADRGYQDEDAIFFDADQDGDLDLYVVSGGYLFQEHDDRLQDRLYLNDGKGNLTRSPNAIPRETEAGGCVVALDVDQDGDVDLFVGSRLIPGAYPQTPRSLFLINDGKGHFTENIATIAPSLRHAGMITDAVAVDVNKDGRIDLAVVGEWMPLTILLNQNQRLEDASESWVKASTAGWWNCLEAVDVDQDGLPDLIAGNYGLNNQFGVSPTRPATLVYKDFNEDGQVDPFFCYFIGDQSYPFASRDEALGQVNSLRSRFTDYNSYSTATLESIFTPEELQDADKLQATRLATTIFHNTGDQYEIWEIPVQAQYAPVHAIASTDIDGDGDADLLLGGNESHVRVRIGKSDGIEGTVLLNDGKGQFTYLPQEKAGLRLKGDVRQLMVLKAGDREALIVGQTGMPIESFILGQ